MKALDEDRVQEEVDEIPREDPLNGQHERPNEDQRDHLPEGMIKSAAASKEHERREACAIVKLQAKEIVRFRANMVKRISHTRARKSFRGR